VNPACIAACCHTEQTIGRFEFDIGCASSCAVYIMNGDIVLRCRNTAYVNFFIKLNF